MKNKTYTYKDLIEAYCSLKRFQRAHRDLKDYYSGLYEGLSAFFQVDFDEPLCGEDRERKALRRLFDSAIRYRREVSTPFSGMMEAPAVTLEIYHLYGRRLNELCDQLKELYFLLLCDLYRRIYGDSGRSITSEALKRQGFDDSAEPDELDYW